MRDGCGAGAICPNGSWTLLPEPAVVVVADRAMPGIGEALASLGPRVQAHLLPAGAIDAQAVRNADLLLVRSTVRCGAELLEGSRVRLVATATSGIDHLDLAWLQRAGIAWAHAPGCNADAVVHWLAGAVCLLGRVRGWSRPPGVPPLAGLRAGVVGVGEVGRRAVRLLEALGAEVLCCDPPRQREGGDGRQYLELDALCRQVDLLTLHVPLLREGQDRTVDLIDRRRLHLLPPDAAIFNSSRGEVVAEQVLRDPQGRTLLCDVFPGEPEVDPALVRSCLLATPHIAGHSLQGRVRGTVQVYHAVCRFLGVQPCWQPGPALWPPPLAGVRVGQGATGDLEVLAELLGQLHDLEADDRALRRLAELPPGVRGAAFRHHRDTYPLRHELTEARIELVGHRPALRAALTALGAHVTPACS
ncbi:MAG: 4-phosphoerythronate dehydrogenase [Myxococcales bacterium]|nr:4-phosphoerythronate dehydrogenase [Myxococcales bacterium]